MIIFLDKFGCQEKTAPEEKLPCARLSNLIADILYSPSHHKMTKFKTSSDVFNRLSQACSLLEYAL